MSEVHDAQVTITTNPFQNPVGEMKLVHICQTIRNVNELDTLVEDTRGSSDVRTSSMRFTSGFP